MRLPAWLPDVITQHLTGCPPGPDGLIFTAPYGGPVRRNTFQSRFWLPAVADSVASRCGSTTSATATSPASSPNASTPPSSPPGLGHTSVKTVLDVYGHRYEGLDRTAANTLDPPWTDPDVDAMWRDATDTENKEEG